MNTTFFAAEKGKEICQRKHEVNTSLNSTAQEWKNPEKRGYRNLTVPDKTLGNREGGPIQKRDLGSGKAAIFGALLRRCQAVPWLAFAGLDQKAAR